MGYDKEPRDLPTIIQLCASQTKMWKHYSRERKVFSTQYARMTGYQYGKD